jgi:hypothetical protein
MQEMAAATFGDHPREFLVAGQGADGCHRTLEVRHRQDGEGEVSGSLWQ